MGLLPGMTVPDPVRTARVVRDTARLEAVDRLAELGADPWCERLAEDACARLRAPVASLSLVGRHRQRLVGAHGLPEPLATDREIPLTLSLCQYVVGAGAPMTFDDARRHPLVHDNRSVTELGLVSYAGAPVRTRTGLVVGSFCVIDQEARVWTPDELDRVADYAALCAARLDGRRGSAAAHANGRPHPRVVSAPALRLVVPAPDRPAPGGRLWRPAAMLPGLRLGELVGGEVRDGDLTWSGRLHGTAVTVRLLVADRPAAQARFARAVDAYVAFGPTPRPFAVGTYLWSDNDGVLVLAGDAGRPVGPTGFAEIEAAAVALSAWSPATDRGRDWHVDYDRIVDRHERQGRLTGDEAHRLRRLLRRCDQVRTFAHGSLTPAAARRLPSGRVGLTGFGRSGHHLPGRDLATLLLAADPGDHATHERLLRRVVDVDILEPFTVSLLLAAADLQAAGQASWARLRHGRRLATHLLHRVG
ncbi:GAF domain-containing protein [Dactylosporangium sp. NPDC005572]|uniref:GAF domain-containing protein n=1 Tax=Dactylosporangium sp. NPDC005572 TaxID=3156889 RepID=UPI00339E4662